MSLVVGDPVYDLNGRVAYYATAADVAADAAGIDVTGDYSPEPFQMQETEILMPREDILPLSGYEQTMPLAQPDEPLQRVPLQEEHEYEAPEFHEFIAGSIGAAVGGISKGFAAAWSWLTGAPWVEGWDQTSDYMAGSDDPRWQVLHDFPPVELAYNALHPYGYTPGGDDMSMYGQPGGPGAPWDDDSPSSHPYSMTIQRTDPISGREYTPGIPSHTTILKTWWAGPRGGPRIRFVMFMHGNRKMIGCHKLDGSWKQWPAKSGSTIVIGKNMTDAKARRVAKRMERYSKTAKKILGLLGYKVSRK